MIRPLAAVSLLLVPALAQTTLSFQAARDCTLYESSTGTVAAGAALGIYVGVTGQSADAKRRGLLWFDVASRIPVGARIVSTRLTLNVAQAPGNLPLDMTAHRVLSDWGEGTSTPTGGQGGGGAGGVATTGDATWINTFFPGVNWSNAGGDFAATNSFEFSAPAAGMVTTTTTAASRADVQSWVDNPTQNFGWLLKTDETQALAARRFDSRENGNGRGNPPVLEVTFLTRGEATTFGTGCPVGSNTFSHTWVGLPIGGTSPLLTQADGPPNQLAANLLALNWDPVGFPLLPACNFYLPLLGAVNHSIITLDPTGAGSTPLALPAGFPGVLFTSQTAALDPNAPGGFVLSNAAVALLQ
ncbi:MAG: DNRLRE domain-containing protein [bacterium]|nr:DNRLRE domain-containing protein [bacterium]